MKLAVSLLAGSVACTVLAGCADDGPGSLGPAPAPAGALAAPAPSGDSVTVVSADNRFQPLLVEVSPGTEVVWVNRGRNEHDILSDFGFGVTAAEFHPGDEYRHVFTEPGEYPYWCSIHGTHEIGMIGTIVVTDA